MKLNRGQGASTGLPPLDADTGYTVLATNGLGQVPYRSGFCGFASVLVARELGFELR